MLTPNFTLIFIRVTHLLFSVQDSDVLQVSHLLSCRVQRAQRTDCSASQNRVAKAGSVAPSAWTTICTAPPTASSSPIRPASLNPSPPMRLSLPQFSRRCRWPVSWDSRQRTYSNGLNGRCSSRTASLSRPLAILCRSNNRWSPKERHRSRRMLRILSWRDHLHQLRH